MGEVVFNFDGTRQEFVWELEELFRTSFDVTIQFDGDICDFFVDVNTVELSSDASDRLFDALKKHFDDEDEADDAWDNLDGRAEWYVQEVDGNKLRFIFDQYLFWTGEEEDGDFEIEETDANVLKSWDTYIVENVLSKIQGVTLI